MVKGYYINLASQTGKAEAVEDQLNQFGLSNYSRFEACTPEDLRYPELKLQGGEKGCFISHLEVLKLNAGNNDIVHIFEDDVVLSSKMKEVHGLVEAIGGDKWDLIFTDILVQPGYNFFFKILDLWETFKKQGTVQLFNLHKQSLTGATSYFVNPKSIKTLIHLLESSQGSGIPYDLLLRQFIDREYIKAVCFVPFFSYPRCEIGHSDIRQTNHLDVAFARMRQAFFLEANHGEILEELKRLSEKIPSGDHIKIYSEFFKIVAKDLS